MASVAAAPSRRVVLVSPDGSEQGTADKVQVHQEPVSLHRGVSLYLFRDDELLITQRSFHKRTWPGVWSNTCCGHPQPGEGAVDAALRHLDLELGIVTLAEAVVTLPDFSYSVRMGNGWAENELCPVVAARVTGDPQIHADPHEVADVRWLPWASFVQVAEAGLTSPWSRLQVAALVGSGFTPADLPLREQPRVVGL